METLETFLEANPLVEYFRFQWVDYSGVFHGTIIPKPRCLQVAANKSKVCVAQNIPADPISPASRSFFPVPERWVLRPDWTSLRLCGHRTNHAAIMCFIFQDEPAIENGLEKCPRHALDKIVRKCDPITQFLVGFEIEFLLLDGDNKLPELLDRITGEFVFAGLRGATMDFLERVCAALKHAGIEVYSFQSEHGDQLEISLSPLPPMEAVDAVYHALETIRALAITHGFRASVSPQPVLGGPKSGLHAHVSMNPLPSHADAFIAGVLDNIKAVCAFGLPYEYSYRRCMDGGAGFYIGWGTENRDLPIRKVSENRWEFRFIDGTANLYLVMAALLAAGLNGIESATELRWKDCKVWYDFMTPEELERAGITEQMPTSMLETLEAVEQSDVLRTALGDRLVDQYLRTKHHDFKQFLTISEDEQRLSLLRYF